MNIVDPVLIYLPIWGALFSIIILVWAGSLCFRLASLWRWTTELERWKTVKRQRREEVRRLLNLG